MAEGFGNTRVITDENNEAVGFQVNGRKNSYFVRTATDPLTGMVTLTGANGEFLVVSSTAPSNADGRANGTIYIQTV